MLVNGVGLGMTRAQVLEALGEPRSSKPSGPGEIMVFPNGTVVGLQHDDVCMVHGQRLLVGTHTFAVYDRLAALAPLLTSRGREETRSADSVKHVFEDERGHVLRTGESTRYPGQCLAFTLGSPP